MIYIFTQLPQSRWISLSFVEFNLLLLIFSTRTGKVRSCRRAMPQIRWTGAACRISVLSKRWGRWAGTNGCRWNRACCTQRQASRRRGHLPPSLCDCIFCLERVETMSWAYFGPIWDSKCRYEHYQESSGRICCSSWWRTSKEAAEWLPDGIVD